VVPRSGAQVTEAELQELVKQKKGSHYAPKVVEFIDDLPRTAVGKVDKENVRRAYWTGTDRNVN
jgi:acyl-coenzyme A synthetase/AMP-(fatty) acid ligase